MNLPTAKSSKLTVVFTRVLVCALVICLLLPTVAMAAEEVSDPSARPLKDKYTVTEESSTDILYGTGTVYSTVLKEYAEKGYKNYKGEDIVIPAISYSAALGELTVGKAGNPEKDAITWENGVSWITWEIDVPETALYNLEIDYYCNDKFGRSPVRNFYIDDEQAFDELNGIYFYWSWDDVEKDVVLNNIGDQITPNQELVYEWLTKKVIDNDGFNTSPFKFYLTKGKHTLKIEHVEQEMIVSELRLTAPVSLKTYEEVAKDYEAKGYKDATADTIKFQAEDSVAFKNSSVLRKVTNADPASEPFEMGYKRLNVMGDGLWSQGGQTISWEFEVPEDGLYTIGARVYQSYNAGIPVYRQVEIDGAVPFQELDCYKFVYNKDWRGEYLKDAEGTPYKFYLTKGTHTITMNVITGEFTEDIASVLAVTQEIADLYLKIIMVTGPNPDPNYEYEIVKSVPGIIETITDLRDRVQAVSDHLSEISNSNSSVKSLVDQVIDQLSYLIKKPDSIPNQLSEISNSQSTLSSVYESLQGQPLAFDYFIVNKPNVKLSKMRSSGWAKFIASVYNFILSFSKDYDSVGVAATVDEEGNPLENAMVIDVWTARGTERSEILKNLVDQGFSSKTGIYINLNIVPPDQINAAGVNALMLSIISGTEPDVALGIAVASPGELAFRGAAQDISQFEGFDEVTSNLLKETLVPFTFQNKVYALPETIDFRVLYYRKDILQTIGATVPGTWEEMYTKTLPVLYQNQMSFFCPLDYATFLFQHNGEYYTEDYMESALNSTEAYAAFKELVEIYTSYGLDYTTNFFNRFRTGDLPMGIGGFGDYMSITYAAPDIAGKWDIALIPGHENEDGSINRTWSGCATGADMIFSTTTDEKKKASWEFIKWWLSTEVQEEYGRQCEAVLGPTAKVNSANKYAYENGSWTEEHLKIIKESWQSIKEVPPVLGGYFTGRHFTNAWNRIVVDNRTDITMRDSLEQAYEDINAELRRKQREYSSLFE